MKQFGLTIATLMVLTALSRSDMIIADLGPNLQASYAFPSVATPTMASNAHAYFNASGPLETFWTSPVPFVNAPISLQSYYLPLIMRGNSGRVYYVATTGSDNNPGTLAQPWLTIQKAANTLVAGDTVLIRNGTFHSTSVVTPKNSGTANAYITYQAYPGEHPEVITDDWAAIWLNQVAYIEINGLIITAKANLNSGASEYCQSGLLGENAHHIRVINNIVRGTSGNGIGFETGSDYAYVEGNIVYDNCWGCSSWRGSAINFHRLAWYDQAPGFHNIARKNLVYHNYHDPTFVKNHSDGNAFTVDESTNNTPPVLIENNVAFDNAGPCLTMTRSSNTTFRNNTCYQNVSDTYQTGDGELNNNGSTNVWAYNNILIPRTGNAATFNYNSTNLTYDYNLAYGGSFQVGGPHDIIARSLDDIKLANPSLDPTVADFHILSGSLAIDKALASQSPIDDFDGISRPQGAGYDIGAYEYVP